jgi:hypothetical protein
MTRTSAGNAAATQKFRHRQQQFPGLEHGPDALKGWSSDMSLLYTDMKQIGLVTTDAQTVADLELILQNKDTVNNNTFWARCTDQFKNETVFAGGTLTVNAYIQKIKSYAETALCARQGHWQRSRRTVLDHGVRRVCARCVFVVMVVLVCAGSEIVFVVVRRTGELVGGGASSEFAGGWAGVVVVV